jgi:hypothetical protein
MKKQKPVQEEIAALEEKIVDLKAQELLRRLRLVPRNELAELAQFLFMFLSEKELLQEFYEVHMQEEVAN